MFCLRFSVAFEGKREYHITCSTTYFALSRVQCRDEVNVIISPYAAKGVMGVGMECSLSPRSKLDLLLALYIIARRYCLWLIANPALSCYE